jgi:hypothetical protein
MKQTIYTLLLGAGLGLIHIKGTGQAVLIASNNGTTSSFTLSNVQSMVFTNNTIVVHNDDCEEHHFSLFFTDYMTLDGTIAVQEKNESNELSIYPNPTQEQIILASSGAAIGVVKVYSATGVLVMQEFVGSQKGTLVVDALAPGMYIVVTESQTMQFIKK